VELEHLKIFTDSVSPISYNFSAWGGAVDELNWHSDAV
jgi:hypothetical protein